MLTTVATTLRTRGLCLAAAPSCGQVQSSFGLIGEGTE